MKDRFRTISGPAESLLKVLGSKFFGRAFPAERRDESERIIGEISRRYHNATHHCFAYRLGTDHHEDSRFSDAGEPSGTAGKPILQCICDNQITDVLVVVTRYFGGTKLGTGGLQQAYRETTDRTIGSCLIINRFLANPVEIRFEYVYQNAVMRLINCEDVKIADSQYSENVSLLLNVRVGKVEALKRQLEDASRGSIAFKKYDSIVKV